VKYEESEEEYEFSQEDEESEEQKFHFEGDADPVNIKPTSIIDPSNMAVQSHPVKSSIGPALHQFTEIKYTTWLTSETAQLFELHSVLGPDWTAIHRFIPSKSPSQISAQFYSFLHSAQSTFLISPVLMDKFPSLTSSSEILAFLPVAKFLIDSELEPHLAKAEANKKEPEKAMKAQEDQFMWKSLAVDESSESSSSELDLLIEKKLSELKGEVK
jgi:hypothetical protein